MADFSSLNLSKDLLETIQELGFAKMTPIQEKSIPLLLKGKDLIGQSKTGSGKTVAFALPILQKINIQSRDLQALILCPTRELCTQVAKEIRRLGRRYQGLQVLIMSGGQEIRPQLLALNHGAHIIVGTPGRVLDFIKRDRLDLSRVSTLVLDEADRMLDMGFQEDMEIIMDEVPGTRQTAFFSATYPSTIKSLSRLYQDNPEHIVIEDAPEEAPNIQQYLCKTEAEKKLQTLLKLLQQFRPEAAIVFCNLKVSVAELGELLVREGVSCAALHGDLEQDERNEVLAKFRNGSTRVLIATDVAARGLDIEDLPMVFNFDLPFQPDSYVHRIGRTGRAGRTGVAISLATFQDSPKIEEIESYIGKKFEDLQIDYDKIRENGSFTSYQASMETIFIAGGRKDKVRPGDILGALTGEAGGLEGSDIGKIEIHDRYAFVAVKSNLVKGVLNHLRDGKIKGRKFFTKIV